MSHRQRSFINIIYILGWCGGLGDLTWKLNYWVGMEGILPEAESVDERNRSRSTSSFLWVDLLPCTLLELRIDMHINSVYFNLCKPNL